LGQRISARVMSAMDDGSARMATTQPQQWPTPPAHAQGSRNDVLEIDTHLRTVLPPRPNCWSDGLPYVPDGDIVALRVVHHGDVAGSGWAQVGGCRYTNPDGTCSVEEEDSALAMRPMPELAASWAVRAGPRDMIYFDPGNVRAAIVTVGGLCPGLNHIVQALVKGLSVYGVQDIVGIRYGLRGFYEDDHPPVKLTMDSVDAIHLSGGTVLGTSRGGSDVNRIVEAIQRMRLSQVYIIGGNGGNAAVDAIHRECIVRDYPCAVVGLPKSIDNDILLIDSCFGFDTATSEAQRSILAANTEARSAHNGVGVVKLMGRQSGFISAQASVAAGVVDICLVPEVSFHLPKLLAYVLELLKKQGHAVIVVAEGAAQDTMRAELEAAGHVVPAEYDASGNPLLLDVGKWLCDKLKQHGAASGMPLDLKYISPAYMIRSVSADTVDAVMCRMLGHSAVHGAMAGFSGFTAGICSRHHVYLPSREVVRATRRLDPRGRLYRMMRAALGQPELDGVHVNAAVSPGDPDEF